MIKIENKIILKDKEIAYTLEFKKVKNINLRIKTNGTIYVSANKRAGIKAVEEFIKSKEDLILKTLLKFKEKNSYEKIKFFDENEIESLILGICENVYPYFEEKGIKYPEIKFRKMISQWGNCRKEKGILTFNKNLIYAPFECIRYVVLHEFTHFLEPNHSDKFYKELEKVCSNYKELRKRLKNIIL